MYQYIIHSRVDKFKHLIENGTTPFAASLELGVEYKEMARNFKKITGLSPREYASKQTTRP